MRKSENWEVKMVKKYAFVCVCVCVLQRVLGLQLDTAPAAQPSETQAATRMASSALTQEKTASSERWGTQREMEICGGIKTGNATRSHLALLFCHCLTDQQLVFFIIVANRNAWFCCDFRALFVLFEFFCAFFLLLQKSTWFWWNCSCFARSFSYTNVRKWDPLLN